MGSQTIRLGRLFGLEIGFNWSLLPFFLLVAWTMATEVLPSGAPGLSSTEYWIAGVLGTFVFYACLLAHELSHALVAKAKGVKVSGITLWLFGGVTQLEGEPSRAQDQALITAVGPLTSLALAAFFFGAQQLLPGLNAPPILVTLFAWMALLNLVLGAFNLVPALPLDGGRLLGAVVWWRTGSKDRGTTGAVRVGRFFAYLLIALGALEVVAGGLLNGLWLALIGWFLLSAGAAEGRQVGIRSRLRQVPVAAVMTSPVPTLPSWLTCGQLAESGGRGAGLYALHGVGGEMVGFLPRSRVDEAVRAGHPEWRLEALAVAAEQLTTVRPDEDLEAALVRLGPHLEQGALVVADGQLVGTLAASDVARVAALAPLLGPRPQD